MNPVQAVDLKHDLVAVAATLKHELDALILHLREASKGDIDGLCEAIQKCQKEGLPKDSPALVEAQQSLDKLKTLLLELNSAMVSRDMMALDALISECQTKGMPQRYFHEALLCQQKLVSLMNQLDSARKRLDLQKLDQAIQDRLKLPDFEKGWL